MIPLDKEEKTGTERERKRRRGGEGLGGEVKWRCGTERRGGKGREISRHIEALLSSLSLIPELGLDVGWRA